jgi:hypothetical protein
MAEVAETKKAKVVHSYARVGFDPLSDSGLSIYNVAGPGRGVRPITEVEW